MTLYASIRSARSISFKPGQFALLTIPAQIDYNDNVDPRYPEQKEMVFLAKLATRVDKLAWHAHKGSAPSNHVTFFKQRQWLCLIGDETCLCLEAFLSIIPTEEEEENDTKAG